MGLPLGEYSLGAAPDLAWRRDGQGRLAREDGSEGSLGRRGPGTFLEGLRAGWVAPCDLPCLLSFPAPLPRYHNVGILVLFLHDISDVQLEFTKLNVYFKSRGGSHHPLHALAADLGCLSFSLSW